VKDQVSHPHKTTGKIIVLYTLISKTGLQKCYLAARKNYDLLLHEWTAFELLLHFNDAVYQLASTQRQAEGRSVNTDFEGK
jgi:hypothetical protein